MKRSHQSLAPCAATLENSVREDPVPNLFLVGAPKCGTTSVYEYLRRHPQIFFPFDADDYGRVKEPNHLCPELEILDKDAIRDRKRYLALYRGSEYARWRGDASTNYLLSKTAPERIRRLSPGARILIMLRPPLDQMRSYHGELLRHGQEDIVDFYEALDASEYRRRGLRIPDGTGVPRCLDYFAISRFDEQVKRYYDVFGEDAVKVVLLEDMVADPATTFRDILAFLDVDVSFRPVFKVHNETPRYGLLERVVTAVYTAPLARRVFGAVFPWRARRAFLLTIRRIDKGREQPDPRDRRLRESLAPDVARLASLIGRDLDHWQPWGTRANRRRGSSRPAETRSHRKTDYRHDPCRRPSGRAAEPARSNPLPADLSNLARPHPVQSPENEGPAR